MKFEFTIDFDLDQNLITANLLNLQDRRDYLKQIISMATSGNHWQFMMRLRRESSLPKKESGNKTFPTVN